MKLSWLHRIAVLLAACTVVLIFAGDCYSTNEYRPFYPVGQFHIKLGWSVAALTVAAAIGLWSCKTCQTRTLGWLLAAVLFLETLLGLWSDPEAKGINVTHALLGQVFFALIAVVALLQEHWNNVSAGAPAIIGTSPNAAFWAMFAVGGGVMWFRDRHRLA